MKLSAKRGELVQLMQKFEPRSHVGIFRNECTQSTPLDPKLMFWCISYHLGAFGTIRWPYKLGAKRSELGQKFRPRSRVGVFRDEDHFGAFGTIWLLYQSRSKMKSRRNFSQRTHPIDPIGP